MKKRLVTVAISGAFDPIHVGHLRYVCEAAKLGHTLVVILNGNNFLPRKMGLCSGHLRMWAKLTAS